MNLERETYGIVLGNFEIQAADDLTLEEIRGILALRIRELLDKNVEKLVSILYRIDISQQKIDEIFERGNSSKDEISLKMAELVIERQLMKVQTRRQYKQHGGKIE
jgi:hypothetical protein